MAWVHVEDFRHPGGWVDTADGGARSRWYCEQLEAGQILLFDAIPFELAEADRQFLLGLQPADSRYHKNISYRPKQDVLRGYPTDRAEEVQRLHRIMREYSARVTEMLARFLAPYAGHWSLDYASFRPLEEEGRSLPLHKRNDLLHVDAFPSRPTHGGRILRVFTNLNPTRARVWLTAAPFDALAPRYANDAGLARIAARSSGRVADGRPPVGRTQGSHAGRRHTWLSSLRGTPASSPMRALGRLVAALRHAVGLGGVDRSPYDQFMLRFHDYLKENSAFQQECSPTRLEFPPNSTWVVFTDGVPHAALAGQFALEQTYIIPVDALLAPQHAPLRLLEGLCGRALS